MGVYEPLDWWIVSQRSPPNPRLPGHPPDCRDATFRATSFLIYAEKKCQNLKSSPHISRFHPHLWVALQLCPMRATTPNFVQSSLPLAT